MIAMALGRSAEPVVGYNARRREMVRTKGRSIRLAGGAKRQFERLQNVAGARVLGENDDR